MKPNDFAALLNRVENECQNETHEDDLLDALFIEREIDRAVRKARREERALLAGVVKAARGWRRLSGKQEAVLDEFVRTKGEGR